MIDLLSTFLVVDGRMIMMKKKINSEIDSAFRYAKKAPFPDADLLNLHIYKD